MQPRLNNYFGEMKPDEAWDRVWREAQDLAVKPA
jgi:hypothetical protein